MATSKLAVKLKTDSGISSTDLVTNNGALQISGALSGDKLYYRVSGDNGTSWTTWTSTTGSIPSPTKDGAWIVQVQEKSKSGALVASTSLTFTRDTVALAPTVGLQTDSGLSSTDNLTHTGLLKIGVETGAKVQYSVNSGSTWTSSFAAVEGLNSVWVRQTDVAGNLSAIQKYSFTLDTKAGTALGIGLLSDSSDGGSGHDVDLITNNANLTLSGLETGATVEYSADGSHWGSSFVSQEGANTVYVRQIDVAGNVSTASQITFTLDTQGPMAGSDVLAAQTDVAVTIAGADLLSNDTDSSGLVNLVSVGAQSANGGTVIDNLDGTFTYLSAPGFTGTDSFTYQVSDIAGNLSEATVSVDVTAVLGTVENLAPVVYQDLIAQSLVNSAPITIDALAYAYDPEGGALSVAVDPVYLPEGVAFDSQNQSFVFDASTYLAGDVVSFNYGITDGQLTTLAGAAFYVTEPSPFTAFDTLTHATSDLTQALLAVNSGIQVDSGSIVLNASGFGSTNFYDGCLSALGIGSGLLLTSGTTPGTVNTSTGFGADNGGPLDPVTYEYLTYNGDADLNAVVNTVFSTTSYDATTLSFNFSVTEATATSISFNLVFGSDEYPEWVDAFVDSAIVLVNGQNVALFNHNAMSPLSVIGSNLSAGYFQDNADSHLPTEYDGVSKVLTIVAPIHQGSNTIKIGIGDTGDHILDSGIFLANLKAGNWAGSGVLIEDTDTTSGDDHLQGTTASDLVDLGTGNDSINTGSGDDIVDGGAGNDAISGGAGADVLTGGSGADDFDYTNIDDWAAYDDGSDTITDFAGNSQILVNADNLDAIDGDVLAFDFNVLTGIAGTGWSGDLQPVSGQFSTLSADYLSSTTDGIADQAHAQFVYDASTGSVAFDADGTGDLAPIAITLLGQSNHPAELVSTAFVIVG